MSEPARGDTAEFKIGKRGAQRTVTGKITSTYMSGSNPCVSVTSGGKRYTRLVSSVTITRKAAGPPEASTYRIGHRPGEPAANRGKTYPAQVLTAKEADAIIAACSPRYSTGIRNRALLTLLRRSGLRVSEVLSLRASDIDLDAHSIRLRATKSQKAQTRGFHPAAVMPLLRWIEERQKLGLDVNGTPLFCTTEKDRAGHPLDASYVRKMMRERAQKAGVEKRAHPHGLRHTFAWDCVQAGMLITEISELLGHSSVAVTAIYLKHLTNGDAIRALEAAELAGTAPVAASLEEQVAALTRQVAALTGSRRGTRRAS